MEFFFFDLTPQLLRTPQNLLDSTDLQMICLSPYNLHNIHSCWCYASQIRISPQSLRQCTVGGEGRQEGVGEKEGEGAASHSYSSSVFGASAGCMLHVILPSSCLLSLTLLLPLSPAFSLPPSSLPVLSLSLSQGFNLWLWSSRNRDDNPHFPLLC